MSRAEERALEAYPIKNEWIGNQYGVYGDVNEDSREKFIQGYEQAIKDMTAEARERVVKVDAGGYPYIDCNIELYDYDTETPLAKAGDKVEIAVIFIKE